MLVKDAIAEAAALTGQVVTQATALRWLSELDGKIAFDVYGADAWAPYTDADTGAELIVDFPWDGQIYVPYLEAMTYYSTGEYDRYENAKQMYETALWDFRKYLNRNHVPVRKCRREAAQCPIMSTECPLQL